MSNDNPRDSTMARSSAFVGRPPIRYFDRQLPLARGPRKNEQIRITPIRLIGHEGEQLGIVPTAQALERAREAGLDLVEVAANESPPVCKILDYGKMRFTNSQKGNKAAKVRKQRPKEIRVRPKTGNHDIDTKIAHARKFLENNDKVQVTVIFRGREMQHQEEGRRVLDAVLVGLAGVGKVERSPAMDGKRMTALLMPIKAAAKPRVKPAVEAKPTA
jgi:translation initiation factor IF-3